MIPIKTPEEIKIMREGGQRLANIMAEVVRATRPGVRLSNLENLAMSLIKKHGGEAAFKKVKDYRWASCININHGVVHGIPNHDLIKKEDLVSLDLGFEYQGFNTDMSVSLAFDSQHDAFLQLGKEALKEAILATRIGNRVSDISWAIETTLKKVGCRPIRVLTGHGVGRSLHEEPLIPGWVKKGKSSHSPLLTAGMVLALEVIYTTGNGEVVLEDDDWTISTQDGKMAGLFEETVAITESGPVILTAISHE